MLCERCGEHIPANSRFCSECGAAQGGRTEPTAALAPIEPGSWAHNPPVVPTPIVHAAAFRDEDIRRLAAAQRSFTTPAVITLVLYIVFWLPGFIANFVYLREANNVARVTGQAPEGKGRLLAMLWVFGVLPALGFGLLLLLTIA